MRPILFTCEEGPSALYGILHPVPEGGDLCAVIMNAGNTHRVGPHRLGVRLSRRLAAVGIPSVRFDLSGIGDSDTRQDGKSLRDQWFDQCQEIMGWLERHHGFRRFVFLGLCIGGIASFVMAASDQRVVGAVLLNTRDFGLEDDWAEFAEMERHAHFYWRNAAFRWSSWKRLFTGRSSFQRILTALRFSFRRRIEKSDVLDRARARFLEQLRTMERRGVCLLWLYSVGDPGRDQLRLLLGKQGGLGGAPGQIVLEEITNADHTFTLGATQREVLDRIVAWMSGFEELTARVRGGVASAAAGRPG
ncbi:MAG: hypothetical protein D6702_02905 [Planctomycetota bacterium]|nr:MAG: hypothetical protein D6702_02905 [Planctomycetota bacterium]